MMGRYQVNLRLDQEMVDKIDDKRVELKQKSGRIPTRSDVIRNALDQYLGPPSTPMSVPGRPRKKKSEAGG